jgi:hypothetical protein
MLTIIDPHIDDERYMCIFYICQLNLISVSWYIDSFEAFLDRDEFWKIYKTK